MSSAWAAESLKYEIRKKENIICKNCHGSGCIPDLLPESTSMVTVLCPDCLGDGVIYSDGVVERSQLARELWKSVWRAARLHEVGNNPVFEAFNLMTDSMLFAHMLDMTPFQLFELIKKSRRLLSDRSTPTQLNMLQYKIACRNGEISFDEELPF